MAMDPLHGIGRIERKHTREHLVEGDAQGVKITPRIDRPVHAARLFRRHVGERSGDDLGWFGLLMLARKTRSNTEAGKPDRARSGVHQNIGGLDVLVDKTLLVELAQRSCKADRKAKEPV